VKKPDVPKLLRAKLDPVLLGMGFKWKRMVNSPDGWYVRAWEGGLDTFGWGLASYSPRYSLGAFAGVRINAVEDLLTPHIPFSPPEAAREALSCTVTDLLAFVEGPDLRPGENMARPKRMVESEAEVDAVADWWLRVITERIDLWWRSTRTPSDLWTAERSWRKFWGHSPPPEMREAVLAFLCADRAEQDRIEREHLEAVKLWPEMPRGWLESLLTDLRAKRCSPDTGG
jgi:hypothetical protein